MTRFLTQAALVLILASGMGAEPGQRTSDPKAIASPVTVVPAKQAKAKPKKPYQVGKASWYGRYFHGRETASGETYNMYQYTAAHPELPLGSWVKVTNLDNSRSVIVRINDRGPVIPGRIIDLSYASARQLQMHDDGLARVQLDLIEPAWVVADSGLAGFP